MSLHVCEYICQDYAFFAVGGTTCWCGKIMTLPQVAISSQECNYKCSGDPSQKCGGLDRSSWYSKKV